MVTTSENEQGIVANESVPLYREYIALTKPRIVISNLITVLGGYLVAKSGAVEWLELLIVLLGAALVMASSCAINNYWDKDMDKYMTRTQNRALPSGRMKPRHVLTFGLILGVVGLGLLYVLNILTFVLGLIGIFVYVVIYTMWLKRSSTHSTLAGAVSGAMPPIIGYCAVSGQLDAGAWILFGILLLWQPPHFFALGIRRVEEYREAGFPLLPVVKGIFPTKVQMVIYIALLVPLSLLLYVFDYVGMIYFVFALVLGLVWLALSISGFWAKHNERWATVLFGYSMIYLTVLFIVMMFDTTPLV